MLVFAMILESPVWLELKGIKVWSLGAFATSSVPNFLSLTSAPPLQPTDRHHHAPTSHLHCTLNSGPAALKSWSPHRVIFFGRFSFISIWNCPSRNSSTAEGNFKTLSSTFLPSFKKYLLVHEQNHCIRVLCTPSGSGNFWDRQTPFADSLIWFLGQRVRPWKCRGWSIGPYARYVPPSKFGRQIGPKLTQCGCSL